MLIDPPMSCRQYAKRRGCSAMAVSVAIKNGRLVKSVVRDAVGNPKIADPDLADQEWAANTDATMRSKAAGGDPAELVDHVLGVPPAPVEHSVDDSDGPATPINLADAAARAKHWDAELKELKFKEAARELIPARDVESRLVDVFSACKVKLLEIPSRAKQALPHLSVSDLQVIEALLREGLEALT